MQSGHLKGSASGNAAAQAAFDQILRRLTEAEVKFVVVGGLALGAWGVVRGTKDVDIVVAPDAQNLKLSVA